MPDIGFDVERVARNLSGQWIDGLIVVTLVFSLITGFFRGFVREMTALAAFAAGLWLFSQYGPWLAKWLERYINQPVGRWMGAGALVLLGAFVVGELVGALLGRLVRTPALRTLDRVLGGLLGVVRGSLIVVLLVLLAGVTPLPRMAMFREARLLPPFLRGAELVIQHLPPQLSKHFHYD